MKMFSDCHDDCYFCRYFYRDVNCLAGHGDDNFTPAKKSEVENLLQTRKFDKWEQEKIQNKLDHWPLLWPR